MSLFTYQPVALWSRYWPAEVLVSESSAVHQFSDFCINPRTHFLLVTNPHQRIYQSYLRWPKTHTVEPYGKTGRQRILQVISCAVDKVVLTVEVVSIWGGCEGASLFFCGLDKSSKMIKLSQSRLLDFGLTHSRRSGAKISNLLNYTKDTLRKKNKTKHWLCFSSGILYLLFVFFVFF